MQDEVLNEIAEIARHFFRLIDPSVSTAKQALEIVQISAITVTHLASVYGLDEASQLNLSERIRTVRAQLIVASGKSVH